VRKILALADIHGTDPVSRAMADALDFAAQQPQVHRPPDPGPRAPPPQPNALGLMRRQDVLELDLPPADL
jgi:hypothetical protein